MQNPASDILSALYHNKRDEAVRLAEAAPTLTIWEASALGRDETVARLAAADPSLPNAAAPDGHFPLGLAAFFGHPSTVRILLRLGADVHAAARNPMQVQPLHAAVASRNPDAVAAILDAGPDVNARQQVGYTPLMGAAASGKPELVELLLARGADPSLVSDDGKTAAGVAREHGHPALAEKLELLGTAGVRVRDGN
jgi:ankyrin repeat protein